MKNTVKNFFALALILTMTFTFTACGGPSTLEEYVNENEETKQMIETANASNDAGEMKVEVKENTVIYTFTLAEAVEDDVKEEMKAVLEETEPSIAPTFETVASKLEEETKIKGITSRLTYLSHDGSEIYSKDFKAKKAEADEDAE